MSHQDDQNVSQKKYKGVRRRKWGKWVSEIRVPGSQERLWLGSYVSPEAAAVAHDIAFYCLRETSSPDQLNLPLMLPASVRRGMSPRSVQKAATDAGMAIDAQLVSGHRMDGIVETGKHPDDSSSSSWDLKDSSLSWWDVEDVTEAQALDITIDDYL